MYYRTSSQSKKGVEERIQKEKLIIKRQQIRHGSYPFDLPDSKSKAFERTQISSQTYHRKPEMKLTIEKAKKFFRHAQRKNKVTSEFIRQHMPAMLRFMQHAITPHIVIKRKVIRKRSRIFLRYNCLRKFIFDPSKLKKRRNAKRIHSQWSKRLVTHLRRYSVVEFIEEESMCAEAPKDVSEQLKEQLELLKSGKRIVPLLEEANITEQRKNSQEAVTEVQIEKTSADIENRIEPITTTVSEQLTTVVPELTSLTAVDIANTELNLSTDAAIKDFVPPKRISTDRAEKPNGNFLDMLISKVKNTTEEVISELPKKNECGEACASAEKSMEPPKQRRKSMGKPATNEAEERENSSSSSDFFGFDDNERILGNCPGMLSTPLVQKRDFNSAFVSETLNAYMRDNSLESSAVVNYPQRRPEDGLVLEKSFPPKLDMPAVPEGLQSLRTVAERRAFLQKTRNTKYCIINNLGTVFRELQKRTKGQRIYRQAIDSILSSNSVPMTRQGWKTSAWLLTEVGNYFFQTIDVDGENFRLYGGKGNHRNKLKIPHLSRMKKVPAICLPGCVDRVTFRSLRPVRTIEKRSKLHDSARKNIYRPCPLSQKIIQQSRDDEISFGGLDIVRMPKVELEVFPQLQKPLPDIAKRYLQLILPYGGISREWAEFSVSTLIERQKMVQATNPQRAFIFTLPYANDRNHVIIRRLYKRSEAFEERFDKSSLSFRRKVDEMHANGEATDSLALECADVLTDMLNSVAISCSENSFIKNDPDNIYQNDGDDEMMVEKSVKKTELNQHQQHPGMSHRKQSRLLMELKRLNATVIDAATTKSEEGGSSCDKECCKLGCVCSSLNEGSVVRKHCGKQRCVLECRCKCPSVMRLETDGRTITTEDAFMLRRQATARLARVEKEFTSTIVLTGNETLLINESQYDKKRRCTKIPKRYGDFVDPDEPDFIDSKPHKRTETPPAQNFPLEPVLVKDIIYNHLKHSSVNLKKLHDVKDLAPWCMIHMVYKCFCKGQALVGSPIVIEKQEELTEGTTIDEALSTKNRALYSFDKQESKSYEDSYASYESELESSEASDASEFGLLKRVDERNNYIERRGRIPDNHQVETYMNAGLNLCRRVIPIPRNIYQRRNKKRVAHVQLYIAENENDKTRLSLHEHVLRSVYFHKNPNIRCPVPVPVPVFKTEEKPKLETMVHHRRSNNNKQQNVEGNMSEKRSFCEVKNKISDEDKLLVKKRRISSSEMNEGSSLLRINNNKDLLKNENHKLESPNCSPFHHQSLNQGIMPSEHITIPKIANIFSLNTGVVETMGTDAAAAVAINIPQQSSEALASEQNISPDAVTSVFNVVIKNMNNLVSKKMQDIDMALRRESKAIPAPNAEILCIIRWNNFLEAYLEGFVYLWEVRTSSMTFIAATIKPLMPLVMNALSVINIQALPKENLPLLGRMLIDRKKNEICDGLAVVMQGQQMYWFVKGFLRPDKTRVCPKPTPHSHPLLTRKINILCRLLISQQVNEHKKRQDPAAEIPTALSVDSPIIVQQGSPIVSSVSSTVAANATPQRFVPPKLKVLPMQRNISDHATTILEQMVAQAYGTVRTNVSFRKLYENEIQEIFPPATMNSDHHWLVLDISNDFSHIFIPELKDLLTLDRVQKVMSYAAVKNRIVKMAFGQKSAFNAYVTPKSKRKLYFGPYKHAITAPKLVLLQSVDGQMMLREVYQARHQVNVKALSTTAFWLIQKDGKMFLDLEDEQAQVVDDENPIIIDSELPSIIEQSGRPDRSTTQVSDSLVRENSLNYNTRKEHDDEEEEEEEEDDDDCVIIEDDKAPQISALTLPSNPPRMTERPSQDRLNYTISLGGQNSSLVIQNESKLSNSSLPENTFTILSSNSQSSSVNSSLQKQQQQQHQLLQQQQQHQQKLQQQQLQQQQLQQQQLQQQQLQQQQLQPPSLLHVNSGESTLSQDNSRLFATPTSSSLKIGNELVHPSDIVFTFPTNEVNTNISISAEHFTGVSMESILALQQANLPVKDINTSSIGSQPNSIDERLQTNTLNDHLSGVSIGTIIPHTDLNPSESDHLGGFSIGTIIPNETETNSGKPIEQHDSTCTTEPGSTTRTIVNSKESQIEPISKAATKNTNMSSMQWNRNITIKKVPIEADRDALKTNTFARKSYPVQQKKVLPTLSNQRLSLVQTPSTLTGIPVSNVQYRPKSNATSVRPSNPQANYQTFISHRPIAPKTVTYSHMSNSALPRPTEAQSLSLSVRTPTTVKTLIRAQQQNNTSSQFNHTMIRPSLNATPRVRMPNQGGTPPNRDAGGMKNTTVISRSPMVSSVKAKVISATASQNARVIKSLITPTTAVLPKNNIAAMRFITGQTQPTETAYPKSLHKVLPASKSTLQSSGTTPNDPLKISEGSANNTLSNLTQPNGIRKVYSSEGNCSTPIVNTGSGIKRNSMGTPVVRPVPPGVRLANATTQKLQTESLQSLQNSSKINSTIRYAKEGSHSDPNSQTKGVPIELPKLKKFAIISQSNTTVITPPTAKWLTTSSVQREAIITSTSASKIPADKPSNSDPKSVKLGTIQLLGGKSTPVKTDSTVEKSSSPQKSLNSDTEYGFFHANIEGLPKFVVKRVNENYLIKVPNFNGILKLTGLSTVHNYLNQYTTQKCGKTAEDIVNLKWTFKPQDRSKINIISKSNLPPAKTDNQNQSMQKIAAAKRTPTQGPSSSATSQTKTSPANPVTNLSANDSIVLLDDDE